MMVPFPAEPWNAMRSVAPLDVLSDALMVQDPGSDLPSGVVISHVPETLIEWNSGLTLAVPIVNRSCTPVSGSLALQVPLTGTTVVNVLGPLKSKLN